MAYQVISEYADIYQLPAPRRHTEKIIEITIGDLHANPIKLLFTLVREGICDISEQDYRQIVALYLDSHHLFETNFGDKSTQARVLEIMAKFKAIIERITLITQTKLLRLLGDELADRGSNDWFVLFILDELLKKKLSMTIILSNHLAEFIEAIEYHDERIHSSLSNPYGASSDYLYGSTISSEGDFKRSLTRLSSLIQNGCVSFEEIKNMYQRIYKTRRLCLLDMSSSHKSTIIYSHAPIGLHAIFKLAKTMCIPFQNLKLVELVQSINQYFSINFVQGKQPISSLSLDKNSPFYEVIHTILWNRDGNHATLLRKTAYQNQSIVWVHGHDLNSEDQYPDPKVINLDNFLGKNIKANQGEYKIFVISQ